MRARFAIASSMAFAASAAWAVETTEWPPPPEVLGRMRDLQSVIGDPAKSKEERVAARQELERLLKSPAGRDTKTTDERKSPDERRPARAAIDPYPSVVKPIEGKLPAPPPTARLEVIPDPPRRPTINPSTGSVIQPSTGAAVDPRTGHLLHEVPGGYVDPRTGQFIPR